MHVRSANKERVVTRPRKSSKGTEPMEKDVFVGDMPSSIQPLDSEGSIISASSRYGAQRRKLTSVRRSFETMKSSGSLSDEESTSAETPFPNYRRVYITIEKSPGDHADSFSDLLDMPSLNRISSASSLDTLSNLSILPTSKFDESVEIGSTEEVPPPNEPSEYEEINNKGSPESNHYEDIREVRRIPPPTKFRRHHHSEIERLTSHRLRKRFEESHSAYCSFRDSKQKLFRSYLQNTETPERQQTINRGCTFFHHLENHIEDDEECEASQDYRRVIIEIVKPSETIVYSQRKAMK